MILHDLLSIALLLLNYKLFTVGGGVDSRTKEQFPNRGNDQFENIPPSHHVPIPTESAPGSGSDNVLIMNTSNEDRTTSFFAQPGILAGEILHLLLLISLNFKR